MAGQVIPWNFPLLMLAWKIAPALATGNTVVLKPAETTPLSALFFADICRQAGLPRASSTSSPATATTGAALVAHPDVNKVAFTGSTAVGKAIARTVAGTAQEGHPGAGRQGREHRLRRRRRSTRPSRASSTASSSTRARSAARAPGCWSRSRSQDELLDALKRRLSTLRLGDPLDKNTDIGAINSAEQLARITRARRGGRGRGRRALVPALRTARPPATGSPPTLFTGVTQAHRIAREEIFGPVLSVLTFRTPDEAVAKANNTPYGLSAGIWTEKGSRILAMANKLRAGVVWANTFNKFDPTSPFGGYKESGYGREGGRHGLEAYLDV